MDTRQDPVTIVIPAIAPRPRPAARLGRLLARVPYADLLELVGLLLIAYAGGLVFVPLGLTLLGAALILEANRRGRR